MDLGERHKRAGAADEIEFGAVFPYNATPGDSNFSDFTESQLNKFRVV